MWCASPGSQSFSNFRNRTQGHQAGYSAGANAVATPSGSQLTKRPWVLTGQESCWASNATKFRKEAGKLGQLEKQIKILKYFCIEDVWKTTWAEPYQNRARQQIQRHRLAHLVFLIFQTGSIRTPAFQEVSRGKNILSVRKLNLADDRIANQPIKYKPSLPSSSTSELFLNTTHLIPFSHKTLNPLL